MFAGRRMVLLSSLRRGARPGGFRTIEDADDLIRDLERALHAAHR